MWNDKGGTEWGEEEGKKERETCKRIFHTVRISDLSAHPKICQFDLSLAIQKHISRLQVAMDNVKLEDEVN